MMARKRHRREKRKGDGRREIEYESVWLSAELLFDDNETMFRVLLYLLGGRDYVNDYDKLRRDFGKEKAVTIASHVYRERTGQFLSSHFVLAPSQTTLHTVCLYDPDRSSTKRYLRTIFLHNYPLHEHGHTERRMRGYLREHCIPMHAVYGGRRPARRDVTGEEEYACVDEE